MFFGAYAEIYQSIVNHILTGKDGLKTANQQEPAGNTKSQRQPTAAPPVTPSTIKQPHFKPSTAITVIIGDRLNNPTSQ